MYYIKTYSGNIKCFKVITFFMSVLVVEEVG